MSLGGGSEEWIGPKNLTRQHYIFADAYFNATGRERTYKHAAIVAGHPEKSAHAMGHKWSKFTAIQNYWRSLDESYAAMRRSMHMKALQRQEELAQDPETPVDLKHEINDSIVEKTSPAIYSDDSGKGAGGDEATQNTLMQIMLSMKHAFGDDDNV